MAWFVQDRSVSPLVPGSATGMLLSGVVGNWGPMAPAFQVPLVHGFDLATVHFGQEPLFLMARTQPWTNYFPHIRFIDPPEFLTIVNHHTASSSICALPLTDRLPMPMLE